MGGAVFGAAGGVPARGLCAGLCAALRAVRRTRK